MGSIKGVWLPRWDRLCFEWYRRCVLRFGTQQRVYGTLPGAWAAFTLVTRGPPLSSIGVTSSPFYACPPEAASAPDDGF
jgi:hypothetical protein